MFSSTFKKSLKFSKSYSKAYIVGVGTKKPGKYYKSVFELIKEAFNESIKDATSSNSKLYNQFPVYHIDGVITHATLEKHLMLAHYLCGHLGLRNDKILAKTLDVGGVRKNVKFNFRHLLFLVY